MAHDSAHERDELEGATDDPAAFPLAYAGVVGSLILLVTIILVTAFFYSFETRYHDVIASAKPAVDATRLRDAQMQDMSSYRFLDAERKVVGLPIDVAMARVIETGGVLPPAPASRPATP